MASSLNYPVSNDRKYLYPISVGFSFIHPQIHPEIRNVMNSTKLGVLAKTNPTASN